MPVSFILKMGHSLKLGKTLTFLSAYLSRALHKYFNFTSTSVPQDRCDYHLFKDKNTRVH